MRKISFVILVISILFFLFGCDLFNKEESTYSDSSKRYPSDVALTALSLIGCPYVWGTAGPTTFDDSGLVCFCYGNRKHVWTTYTFVDQLAGWKEIGVSEAVPGDVVSSSYHCGIYIGAGQMVHAPGPGYVVQTSSVQGDMRYYRLFLP